MKRIVCLLLMFCLLFAGCQYQETKMQAPGNFYYLRTEGAQAVIGSESRETFGHEGDFFYLLAQYLHGPQSDSLRSILPSGTALMEAEVEGDLLTLTFSDDLARLTGLDLTLGCACLTLTCLDLFPVEQVRIQAQEETLDGERYIQMDESCLVLVDQSAQTPPASTGAE